MISKDYTQEMGMKPASPIVPWPIALVILALGGAVLWYTVVKLNSRPSGHAAAAEAPASQAASH